MPDTELTLFEEGLNGVWEGEQAKQVGYGRTILAHRLGDLLVRELELFL
jgi:hypothetical protein